jgi:hypothetical protein
MFGVAGTSNRPQLADCDAITISPFLLTPDPYCSPDSVAPFAGTLSSGISLCCERSYKNLMSNQQAQLR